MTPAETLIAFLTDIVEDARSGMERGEDGARASLMRCEDLALDCLDIVTGWCAPPNRLIVEMPCPADRFVD